jgi:hypothetical protein
MANADLTMDRPVLADPLSTIHKSDKSGIRSLGFKLVSTETPFYGNMNMRADEGVRRPYIGWSQNERAIFADR